SSGIPPSRNPTTTAEKRQLEPSSQEAQRTKRGKYNSNAWYLDCVSIPATVLSTNQPNSDACKKCKLRCNRNEGERDCQRCINTGRPCVYGHPPPHSQPPARVAAANHSTPEKQRSGSLRMRTPMAMQLTSAKKSSRCYHSRRWEQ